MLFYLSLLFLSLLKKDIIITYLLLSLKRVIMIILSNLSFLKGLYKINSKDFLSNATFGSEAPLGPYRPITCYFASQQAILLNTLCGVCEGYAFLSGAEGQRPRNYSSCCSCCWIFHLIYAFSTSTTMLPPIF